MDKMIEEFSKWVINQGFDCKMPLRTVHGIQNADKQPVFSHAVVQACWQAWQASRQALVVQLPENGEPVFKNDFAEGVSSGADIYRSAVEYALDKQGVKYK